MAAWSMGFCGDQNESDVRNREQDSGKGQAHREASDLADHERPTWRIPVLRGHVPKRCACWDDTIIPETASSTASDVGL